MSHLLAQLLLIQRALMILYQLLRNKVLEPFPICALKLLLIIVEMLMLILYPLVIQFNTYLLALLLKLLNGMQLENCLLRTSL